MNINKYINELKIEEINSQEYQKMLNIFGEEEIDNYFYKILLEDNNNKNLDKINKLIIIKNNNLYNEEEKYNHEKKDNSTNDIINSYLSSIAEIRVLTAEEESKYGKIMAKNKNVFDVPEKNKNSIFITKEIDKTKEKVINLEKIFSSITNEKDKNDILKILNNYFFLEDVWKEPTSDKIIKYYLSSYERLSNSLNRVPNIDDLNNYFKNDKLYNIYTNYSSENTYKDMELLKKQIKKYVLYMHARNVMIIHNLKLVFSIAKKLKSDSSFMDVINNGNMGLIKAVETYDYKKNNKFSTYAYWWIRQSIYYEKTNTENMIRMPFYFSEYFEKTRKYISNYYEKNKTQPTVEKISEELNISISNIKQVLLYEKNHFNLASLNTNVGEDEKEELINFVVKNKNTPEDEVISKELKEKINILLGVLTEREKEIIIARYGLNGNERKSLSEIGRSFNKPITRQAVSQMEIRALKKMKKRSDILDLKTYI